MASAGRLPNTVSEFADRTDALSLAQSLPAQTIRTSYGMTKTAFIAEIQRIIDSRAAAISGGGGGGSSSMASSGGAPTGMQMVSVPAGAGGMGGMGMGPSSGGAAAAAGSSSGGAEAASSGGGGGSGSRIVDPMNGIRVTAIDPATSTAIILYEPFDRTAPIPENREGTTAAAAQEATRARVSDSAILKTFLRLLIFGAVEVPLISGRYFISQILATIEKNNRTPSTLLDAIRTNPDITKSDIDYTHPLFEALRAEAAKPRPGIDAGTIAAAIEAYTIGLQSFGAAYNMLLSFNTLMNTYPPLRSQTNSGPQTAAAATSMIPAGIAGKECDLLKKYMIFVYYIRKKYMIRSTFAEDWASIDSDIRDAFMKESPKSLIDSFLEMIKLKSPVKKGARNVSTYTFRGAPVTLVSQNEMRLINGIISNIVQNDSLCKDATLKIKFSQFLTMTEMDVAQIVPAQRVAFEAYVKGLISEATSGAGGPKSAIEIALGGISGKNVRPVFDLVAQKRLADETAAAAREAAARAAAAAEGMIGPLTPPSWPRAVGRTVATIATLPVTAPAYGAEQLRKAATAAGEYVTHLKQEVAEGVGEGLEPITELIGNANSLLSGYGNVKDMIFQKLSNGTFYVYDSAGKLLTRLRASAGDAAGGPAEYTDIGLIAGNVMPGPGLGFQPVGNWGGAGSHLSAGSGGAGSHSSAGSGGFSGAAAGSGGDTARTAGGKRQRNSAGYEAGTPTQPGTSINALGRNRGGRARTAEGPMTTGINGARKINDGEESEEEDTNQGGGYRRTRRAAKQSRKHRIARNKKKTRVNRKRITRRR